MEQKRTKTFNVKNPTIDLPAHLQQPEKWTTNPDEVGKPACKFRRVLIANHWTFLEREQQSSQTLHSPCESRAHPAVTLHRHRHHHHHHHHHHHMSHRHQLSYKHDFKPLSQQ